eukprot:GHRR01030673.1.p1 GENE.GHRR01030673.1~~GHRR01030673.1.p1  ORF type:complete len:101 (+),score=17.90 GHRR01030673.1:440-742(+)
MYTVVARLHCITSRRDSRLNHFCLCFGPASGIQHEKRNQTIQLQHHRTNNHELHNCPCLEASVMQTVLESRHQAAPSGSIFRHLACPTVLGTNLPNVACQ